MNVHKIVIAAVLLLMMVMPSMGIVLPPVTPPDIPICGDVNFFFWNGSSDYGAGYQRLATYPQLQDTGIFSTSVSSANSPQILGDFITDEFPHGAAMAPGITRFRVYLNVSATTGITTIEFSPHLVAANGTIYDLWYGRARTQDISDTTTNPTEYLMTYARRNYTYFEPGSRYMIRVLGSTTSIPARTVSMTVAGNNHASMTQTGYWFCDGTSSSIFPMDANVVINQSFAYDPTDGKSIPWVLWIVSGIIGIILIILALARPKTQRMDYEVNIILSLLSWPFIWYFTWGGLTSVDYIVGAGTTATTNMTAMITQHILYSFWVLGYVGVGGCIFAAFVTALLVSQYNLFKDNEAAEISKRQQKEMMDEKQ
jgi:hypothetical protein